MGSVYQPRNSASHPVNARDCGPRGLAAFGGGLSVAEILGKLRFPYRFLDFGNASELALPKSASRWRSGFGGGASSRGRSREAEGGGPPRVLRDYCRKTLTPSLSLSRPPAPVAPDIPKPGNKQPQNSPAACLARMTDFTVLRANRQELESRLPAVLENRNR